MFILIFKLQPTKTCPSGPCLLHHTFWQDYDSNRLKWDAVFDILVSNIAAYFYNMLSEGVDHVALNHYIQLLRTLVSYTLPPKVNFCLFTLYNNVVKKTASLYLKNCTVLYTESCQSQRLVSVTFWET